MSSAAIRPCRYSWALEGSELRRGSATSVPKEARLSGLASMERCSSEKFRRVWAQYAGSHCTGLASCSVAEEVGFKALLVKSFTGSGKPLWDRIALRCRLGHGWRDSRPANEMRRKGYIIRIMQAGVKWMSVPLVEGCSCEKVREEATVVCPRASGKGKRTMGNSACRTSPLRAKLMLALGWFGRAAIQRRKVQADTSY